MNEHQVIDLDKVDEILKKLLDEIRGNENARKYLWELLEATGFDEFYNEDFSGKTYEQVFHRNHEDWIPKEEDEEE